jgi:predicted DsbA family dithiol-disulfide isomerase
MKIDFVSDVACPWCAVGLNSLEIALKRLDPNLHVQLHMQPFELNPSMAPEGADAGEYLKAKYGMGDAQLAQARATIRERGAAVGFVFADRTRVWNTFDAHRLLHWAGLQDVAEAAAAVQPLPPDPTKSKQRALKHALLQAYHGEGRNPGAADVLVELATRVGLDAGLVHEVLASGAYADEVRQAEQQWQQAGITSVPAVVINDRHLISGGQPPEVFEQALRQIAAEEMQRSS